MWLFWNTKNINRCKNFKKNISLFIKSYASLPFGNFGKICSKSAVCVKNQKF